MNLSSDLQKPAIIAHRGCKRFYPENTIASFEAAIHAGAHMIELDVTFSKDRELIVIHDDTLDRTYPDQYESIITVTTTGGKKFKKHSPWAKGTVQKPMTGKEIEDKFFSLSTLRISAEQAEKISSWITTCETQTGVEELMTLLRVECVGK
jgi:glycerophosphoryl diester phosphodiesterase